MNRRTAVPVVLALVAFALAVPPATAQIDPIAEPWKTEAGRTCMDQWADTALSRLNRHVGPEPFNLGKPYKFDGYGNLVPAHSPAGQLPGDWARHGANRYYRMWEIYRETDRWTNAILHEATVPLMRNFVRQCTARALGGVSANLAPTAALGPSTTPATETRCNGIDLTGTWRSDDGGTYCVFQSGTAILWNGTVRDRGRIALEQYAAAVQGCQATGHASTGYGAERRTGLALTLRILDRTAITAAAGEGVERGALPALRRLARTGDAPACPTTEPARGTAATLAGAWESPAGDRFIVHHEGLRVVWSAIAADAARWAHDFDGTIVEDGHVIGTFRDRAPGAAQGQGPVILRHDGADALVVVPVRGDQRTSPTFPVQRLVRRAVAVPVVDTPVRPSR